MVVSLCKVIGLINLVQKPNSKLIQYGIKCIKAYGIKAYNDI